MQLYYKFHICDVFNVIILKQIHLILHFKEHTHCLLKTPFFKASQKNIASSPQYSHRTARQFFLSVISQILVTW